MMGKSVDNVNDRDTTDLAEDVMELVHTVMHRFRSLQFQSLRGAEHEVTHMEGKALGFFRAHPGATLSDLVQHSGRDKAQLARLVKGLRERALLAGEPDPADRRNVRLSLSPVGHAAYQALSHEARELGARAVQGLGTAQQRELVRMLAHLQANLEREG